MFDEYYDFDYFKNTKSCFNQVGYEGIRQKKIKQSFNL